MAQMRATPGFVDITSDYEAAMPSVQVDINRDRAAAFGVSPLQIETALGSAFGGQRISQINTSSNQYEVIMELLPQYQHDASALDRLYITGSNGTLVPLTAVTTTPHQHGAAVGQPCRPDSRRHHFLRPGARAAPCPTPSAASARRRRKSACPIPSRAISRAPRRRSKTPPRIWARCCSSR